MQFPADCRLPNARSQCGGILDDATGGRKDQGQRELSRRVCRPAACAHRDAPSRAGLDVDVGHPAACLADDSQAGEEGEQRLVDRRPLTNEDERLGSPDLLGPLLEVIRPFRVDDDVMPREEREAFEPLDRPLVVLHHDDSHGWTLASLAARPAPRRAASDPGIPHGCYDCA